MREPLKKLQHIKLVSFSIFNSWYNLSHHGEISVINAQGIPTVKKTPEGNYSLKTPGQALQDTLKSEQVKVKINTQKMGLEIHNPLDKHILLDNELADPLEIKQRPQTISYLRLTKFTNTQFTVIFWTRNKIYTIWGPRAFWVLRHSRATL